MVFLLYLSALVPMLCGATVFTLAMTEIDVFRNR